LKENTSKEIRSHESEFGRLSTSPFDDPFGSPTVPWEHAEYYK
jgi:hypothetical protein